LVKSADTWALIGSRSFATFAIDVAQRSSMVFVRLAGAAGTLCDQRECGGRGSRKRSIGAQSSRDLPLRYKGDT